MSKIKDDLICEIIRISQINLLKTEGVEPSGECDEQKLLDWVKANAADYREKFKVRLSSFSTSELGDILKRLSESGSDLGDIFQNGHAAPASRGASPMNT